MSYTAPQDTITDVAFEFYADYVPPVKEVTDIEFTPSDEYPLFRMFLS